MEFFCDCRFLGLTCFVGVHVCIHSLSSFLTGQWTLDNNTRRHCVVVSD
jgi:hypothetical protein